MKWNEIPASSRNGIITEYRLSYRNAVNGSCVVNQSGSIRIAPINDSESMALIDGLDPRMEYCIQIAGATLDGIGVFGSARLVPCK